MIGNGNFLDKEVLQPYESTVCTNKIFSTTTLCIIAHFLGQCVK